MQPQPQPDIGNSEPETVLTGVFSTWQGDDSQQEEKPQQIETCPDCATEFLPDAFRIGEIEVFRQIRCWPCQEKINQQVEETERKKEIEEKIAAICPPLYRETDATRLPQQLQEVVKTWQYGPTGIGIVGEPGTGKTRTIYLLIIRLLHEGRTCEAINAAKLAALCSEQFSDDKSTAYAAAERLRKTRSTQLLFIDDLGKNKMTERAEMEFYDILEHRTGNLLPTLWTSNAKSKGLMNMMTTDRADAIIRRLKDFSTIYNP